jgi:hypothetical protein
MPSTEQTGQTWLQGVPPPAEFRVADLCIDHLSRQFLATLPSNHQQPLPADLDDLALACLLVAYEHGNRSPLRTTNALESCLAAVGTRFWGDQLPWRLALEFCLHNPKQRLGVNELSASLDHNNSSIRLWMLKIAWLVRQKLDPDEAVPKLLNNMANTLGNWDASAGLCSALHQEEGYFWISAEGHEPEDYADQYQQRLGFIRERGLPAFTAQFEHLELRLRRKTDPFSLSQHAPEP